jgi:hypothetical protein
MPNPPTILITGATDGIGLALARHYQAQGAQLVLVGRRPLDNLESRLFTDDNYVQVDLAQPACATIIAQWLQQHKRQKLDILIQNAGLGYVGRLNEQSPAQLRQLMAVNLAAPIALTHALLPRVAAAQGKIAFISSVVSALPGPHYAVYTASKAGLDGFVRNLQVELRAQKSPVAALLIHPGATRTGMHAKSGATINSERFPSAESVAAAIASALTSERRATTIGLGNRLVQWAGRHLAGPLDWVMLRQARANTRARGVADGSVETNDRILPATPRAPTVMRDLEDKSQARHCVITGAADGIGKALAHAFAQAGYAITGVDVDAARAAQTQNELQAMGANVHFLMANLGQNEELERVVTALSAGPVIDVLIHNAGINAVGPFATSDLAHQETVLAVNLLAPLLLTRGLLAHSALRAGGSLVFVSSLSHFVSYPGAAVYAASKDGVAAFARSLRVALAPNDIHVLTVYPGPTRTAHARRYSPDNRREHRRMPPEQLAQLVLAAVQRRQWTLIPGAGNHLFAGVGRLAPGLVEPVMRRLLFDPLVKSRRE